MSLFEKTFFNILEADEASEVDAAPEMDDKAAMAQELDKGTSPEDFNTQLPPNLDQAKADHLATQKKSLQTWIGEIEKFITFLNGVDGNSVQAQLATASCDSLFEKVASSEKKRIARVAMELSSLNESLKGYLISNDS